MTGDPTLGEIAAMARDSRDLTAAGPASYLFPSPLIPLDREIAAYCAADLDPQRNALEAGIELARRIQRDFEFDTAATLVDTPPHEAFAKRRGAWAEVYLPGAGWIGLDPTNGIWMASDHIVVAVGRDYAEIAPVDGVVLGSGAQEMDVSVDVAPVTDG